MQSRRRRRARRRRSKRTKAQKDKEEELFGPFKSISFPFDGPDAMYDEAVKQAGGKLDVKLFTQFVHKSIMIVVGQFADKGCSRILPSTC